MPLTVVFDTNILLSSIGWGGRPAQCLELARRANVDGVTCAEILDELDRILRTKLQFTDDQAIATRADLLSFLRLVTITNTLHVVAADPDDDKVVECAVVSGASHIVTGDRRHLLPLGQYGAIAIITAAQLLALVPTPDEPPT